MQKPIRLLCLALAFLMIFSIIPPQSYAQENLVETSTEVAEEAFQLPVEPRPVRELDENLHEPDESRVFIVMFNEPDEHFEQTLETIHEDIRTSSRSASSSTTTAPKIIETYDYLYDGVAVEMTNEEADRVAALDNVKSVTPEIIYTIPDTWITEEPTMFSSNDMIGSQYAWDVGYKGEGELVAIIDSGAQVDHPDFKLTDPERAMYPDQASAEAKITELGLSGRYYNEKIVYAFNYRENNHRILENEFASHGQHVAGTVGANGETQGVVPEAQLMVMRVFDEGGTTTSSYYLKAIDDAAKMGASSINMSLGSPAGSLNIIGGDVLDAVKSAAEAGVIVNIAAGNEGQFAYTVANPLSDNPDYGVVGTPAVAPYSLAVASIENDQTLMRIIEKQDGTKISYRIEGGYEPKEFNDVEVVYVGLGRDEDYADVDLSGKVALIKRGEITFEEKVKGAIAKGAIAAILFNNIDGAGFVSMGGVDGLSIMTLQIPADKAELLMDHPVVNIYTPLEETDSITKGQMSDFSNWGLTPEGDLKPEITAPGGNIYSLANDNGYTNMSGTSMAAPHVAGATAIMSQRIENDFPTLTGMDKYQLMKNLMMSTAKPHIDPDGRYTSIRKQGAGVLNLEGAVESDVYAYGTDNMTKIILGDVGTSFTLNANLKNLGTEAITYNTRVVVTTDQVVDGRMSLQSRTLKEIEGPSVTVQGGSTSEVSQSVDISDVDEELSREMPNGYHAEGWIFFEATESHVPDLVIPFHGFRGEWNSVPGVEDFVNNFDLDVSQPTYFDQGVYTSIVTNYDGDDFTMGETTGPEDTQKSFDGIMGISPNRDGFYDDARFIGVFTRNFTNAQLNIYREGEEEPVYNTYPSHSYGAKKNHHSGRNNWPMSTAYSSWQWRGLDNDYGKLQDGNYIFEFKALSDFGKGHEFSRRIPLILDTTPPVIDLDWDEETGVLTASVTDELAGVDLMQIKDAEGTLIEPQEDGTYALGADVDLKTLTIAARDKLFNSVTGNVATIVEAGQMGSINVKVSMNDGTMVPSYTAVIKDADGKTYTAGSQIPLGTYRVSLANLNSDYTPTPKEVVITLTEEEPVQEAAFVLTKMKTYKYTVSVANHDLYENPPIDYTATAEDGTVYSLEPGLFEHYYEAQLPEGKYTVEAKLDEGYTLTPNPFELDLDEDYKMSFVNLGKEGGGSITPVEVNEEGLDLSAVTYVIEDSYGTEISIDTSLADGDYYIYPKNLPEGVYVVPAMHEVKITSDNLHKEVTFTYKSTVDKSGSITPSYKKFDESYPDYELDFVIKDFYGNIVENWDALPLGTYYVSIDNLPKEYYGVNEPLKVELFEDGEHVDAVITLRAIFNPTSTPSLTIYVSDRAYTPGGFDILFTGSDGTVYTKNWKRLEFSTRITLPRDNYYVTVANVTEGTYVKETPTSVLVDGFYPFLDLTRLSGENPLETGNVKVTIEGTEEDIRYEIRDSEGNLIPVKEGLKLGQYELWVLSALDTMEAEKTKIPFEITADETTEVVIRFIEKDQGTAILSILEPEAITMGVGDDVEVLLPETVMVKLAGEKAQELEESTLEIPVVWNTADFSSDEPGETELSGELTLPEGITNPENLKPSIKVVVVEKASIVSVEAVAVTIKEGTPIEDAPLPETVSVELSDGTTILVDVSWNLESYDPETGTLTGTLNLPSDMLVQNPDGLQAIATITIEEQVDPDLEIISVQELESITLQGPVSFTELGLPETITAHLHNGLQVVLDLEWSDEGFDGTVPGTYPLFANLVLPNGITNPEDIKAQIEVTVLIEEEPESRSIVSYENLEGIEITKGNDPAKYLAKAVGVYLDDGTKVYLPVTWTLVNESKEYKSVVNTYKGTIQLPEDESITNPEGLEPVMVITIREQVKPNPEIIIVPTPRPEPKPENPVTDVVMARLFGANRYETAIKISAELARKGGTILIASGENFPDALAGIALAEKVQAPLLLTKKDELPMETAFEAYRLGATKAVILGGKAAVGSVVENKLEELGLDVRRIAGATRHETAVLIAKELDRTDKVILATGSNYPDALSVGALSGSEEMPILLTDAKALTPVTKEALADLKVKEVMIIGGKNVVSPAVEAELKELGLQVERIAGATRYETNALVNTRYYKNADAMVVATGENFADALTGSLLAIDQSTGILLTERDVLPTPSSSYLLQASHDKVFLLGGRLSISDSVEAKIIDLLK